MKFINKHEAILALYSNVTHIRGDVAYDKDEKEVSYDLSAAQAKLTQMQQEESSAKASALSKLAALGLTENEIKALLG